jgi:hypothetical protein
MGQGRTCYSYIILNELKTNNYVREDGGIVIRTEH